MKVISSFGIFKTIYHNDKYLLLLQSFEILDQTSVFLPSKKKKKKKLYRHNLKLFSSFSITICSHHDIFANTNSY